MYLATKTIISIIIKHIATEEEEEDDANIWGSTFPTTCDGD